MGCWRQSTHAQIERYRAIKVLHQYRDLLLREAHQCRILPRLRFLKELPQGLYVVEDLHVGVGPGEVESGKLRDRPQLKAALEQCRLTGATLVIARLDRLSRNVAFLAQLMDSNDVQFVAVDNPHATRFTLHVLAAVAEHEAAQISRRTRDALDAARKRGKRLGGSRPTKEGRGAAVRHQAGSRRLPQLLRRQGQGSVPRACCRSLAS